MSRLDTLALRALRAIDRIPVANWVKRATIASRWTYWAARGKGGEPI